MTDARIARARSLRRTSTSAERRLWTGLRAHRLAGLHFRRQAPIGPFIADFVCVAARLIVEVDGATHSTASELAYDRRREAWLAARGYRTLRFANVEVFENFDGVIETIRLACESPPPPP